MGDDEYTPLLMGCGCCSVPVPVSAVFYCAKGLLLKAVCGICGMTIIGTKPFSEMEDCDLHSKTIN